MCYLQHYHYTQCDHWIHKLSVCLERNNNSPNKCPLEESREVHYDDHCRSCIAYTKQLPKALQHLRLNDRSRVPTIDATKPTTYTVEHEEYDALEEAPNDEDDEDISSLTVEVDCGFDCESPRCTFRLPSPPLISPTSSADHHFTSQNTEIKHGSKARDPSNAILGRRPGGASQSGCGMVENHGNATKKLRKNEF